MVGDTVEILKGKEVHAKLLEGSLEIANAVSTTFGPYGRNVAITMKYNVPMVTKDGATVAGYIKLKDPIKNVAAQIVNQAANETAKVAGDGTTSTTVLTTLLIEKSFKAIKAGAQPMQLRKDLESIKDTVLQNLNALSKEVTEDNIKDIAMVACNGDVAMADMVTEAFKTVGVDGLVTVTDSRQGKTFMDATAGIKLDRSHIIPTLANGQTVVKHKECKIAVLDLDLKSATDAMHVLTLQEQLNQPLLIICNDLVDSAAEIISFNKSKYKIPLEVIRAPFIAEARKEACVDLACVTGSTLLNKSAGWSVTDLVAEHCGMATSVEITSKETNIIGRLGVPEEMEARIKFYEEKIATDTEGLTANYKKRLAFYTSGAAVIYVGGVNETEIDEKKHRFDDTIRAVRSALSEGYVKGGGLTYEALANIIQPINDAGFILKESLYNILQVILSNSGIVTEAMHKENVAKLNIIDPTLVIKSTIQNAVGAAIMVFTTDCVVIRNED
jgi:chaperonin GroEL